MFLRFFFFFKQKTAYDMRISDWSSDVCSSDLIPDRDAERPRLVDEIVLDAGARENDQTGRHRIDQPLIALERRRFLVAIPVRAESDLRHPALVGPAGRSALGAGGRSHMQQHPVGMTGMTLVARRPDMAAVVAGGAAAESA